MRTKLASIFVVAVLMAGCSVVRADAADAPVDVTDNAQTAGLDNGVIRAEFSKANGNLLSLQYRGVEMISRGQGYWNIYGQIPGHAKTQQKPAPSTFRITQDPQKNGGAIGEVAFLFAYHGQPNTVPMDIEIRYTLRRGDSGMYGWTIARHHSGSLGFDIEQGSACLKLNPAVFDFLTIDSRRQREMITGEDWIHGQPLNLKEARRMTTGLHKGEVEHKYDYSAMFSQTPAYGWTSTSQKVGLWVVNPSLEYLAGGPIKVELTGHVDVKSRLPADPTLLFIWHSNHYGGQDAPIAEADSWEKIVGPVLFYCNHGKSHEAMWHDALARAATEQKHWPYAWAQAAGYPNASERGGASGRLVIRDLQAPQASAAGAWVGLAAPPYQARFDRGGRITIDWQTDGKHYQYWARADADGRFTIPGARPGLYTLYAFTDGVLGDFSRADVRIEQGKITDLGDLAWVPLRFGRQLWDIGVPNRSAEEFRHGDHYWQWGLYLLYPREFPHDVDFEIGKSDWRRDWNYAQPPRPDGKGAWTPTTWRIGFHLDHPVTGTATLRLAICGVRGGPLDAAVNGRPIGSAAPMPDVGVMHRDGIRGIELERDMPFDAALLKTGENVIELTKHARAWPDGILYDYLRLELDSHKAFAP